MHRFGLVVAALALGGLAACSSNGPASSASSSTGSPVTPTASSPASPAPASSSRTAPASGGVSTPALFPTSSQPRSTTPERSRTATTSSPPAAGSVQLPLAATTGDADQVITVVATSHSSTVATLQAWQRVTGGWLRSGPSVTAHLGSGGIGRASEDSTRTPQGSFTLTQAFGHDADPGTRLPYTRTTPDDWWISQSASPLYNTRQRCAVQCDFTRGDPNEHLYYETPFYDYAVVIDYNTRNAPGGVRAGAGSAFFLHVTVGKPTQGCVSIPEPTLVDILRWLRPSAHPRILIGVA